MVQTRARHRIETVAAFVSIAAGTVALVMSGVYYLARIGFTNPLGPIAKVALLSLFLVATPGAASLLIRRGEAPHRWYLAVGFRALCGLLLATFLGLVGRGSPVPLALLGLVGSTAFAALLLVCIRQHPLATLLLVAGSCGFAFWCSGLGWGHGYANPLLLESIATHTAPHTTVDTLFHTAIANMMSVHGTPSTGLDGFAPLRYHVGSHWLFVQLSKLLGLKLLEFYQLGFAVTMFPLLFATLCWLAIAIAERRGTEVDGTRPWFWTALLAGTVGVLPLDAQTALAIGWWRPVSESYTTSLVLSFGLISGIVAFTANDHWRSPRLNQFGELVLLWVIVPVGVCACGVTKSSTLALLLVAGAYTFARFRLYRNLVWLVSLLLVVTLASAAMWMLRMPEFTRIFPLHFLLANVSPSWLPVWPIGYFVWVWLFAAIRLKLSATTSLRSLRNAFSNRQLFDVELIAIVAIVGSFPGLLFAIPGQSAGYFSDPQRWFAVSLLLSMPFAFEPRSDGSRRSVWDFPAGSVGVGLLRVAAIGVLLVNTAIVVRAMIKSNVATRSALLNGVPFRSLFRLDGSLERTLDRLPEYGVLRALALLDQLPAAEKANAAVFLPRANQTFWGLLPRCDAPFLAPALSGLPLLGGLPNGACPYFGYWSYAARPEGWEAGHVADNAGCARGRLLGFREVFQVEPERLAATACPATLSK